MRVKQDSCHLLVYRLFAKASGLPDCVTLEDLLKDRSCQINVVTK